MCATLLPAALLLAAAGGLAPCASSSPEVPRVRAVAEGIVAADNAASLERVLDFYAPGAVLLPPNEAPVSGIEAIRPRYEALFRRFVPKIEGAVEEVCVQGSLAVVPGHNGGKLEGRDDAASRELDDVYLMVLFQDADKGWRIARIMWHPASAAPAGK